jgi:hypothetical protein
MKRLPPKRRLLLAMMVSMVLLCGCGGLPPLKPFQPPPDPALFPRSSIGPTTKVAGRVALLVPPQVAATLSETKEHRRDMQLPIGRIVEQAAILAFGEAVSGGIGIVDSPPAAGAGYSATLVIDSVRCVERSRLLWIAPTPIGIVGDSEISVQVAFDLRLLDAQGRTVWSQAYDSGGLVWDHPLLGKEQKDDGILRLAYEGAWRMMQQAVVDLRDWVAGERLKVREL